MFKTSPFLLSSIARSFVVLILVGGCGGKSQNPASTGGPDASAGADTGGGAPLTSDTSKVLFRINAGGPRVAATEPAGVPWAADTQAAPSPYVRRMSCPQCSTTVSLDGNIALPEALKTVPQAVFQTQRRDPSDEAEMEWNLPVPAGTAVEIRLYFVEGELTTSETKRVFSVLLDGYPVPAFSALDVFSQVGAMHASVKTFRTVSAGVISLKFLHGQLDPMLAGLEVVVVPRSLHRVNAGGPELPASDGSSPTWAADLPTAASLYRQQEPQVSATGTSDPIAVPDTIAMGVPPSLFQTGLRPAGEGNLAWSFPVEAGTVVDIRLLLGETEFESNTPARVFDVSVDGVIPSEFDDINVFAEVGHDSALMKTFRTVSDGSIDLALARAQHDPMVKGIEVALAPTPRVKLEPPPRGTPSFSASDLAGAGIKNPTSLQFGPDGRLYVSRQNGLINVYKVVRKAAADYGVTATETIDLVQKITNHDDDTGAPKVDITTRQVTGLLVAGTAENPVLYVTSSDPRIGAGGGGSDLNLDTNSGVLSQLTWTGGEWLHVQLVRGLPRSEENHASNGMALDPAKNILYVAQGGHTNAGAPSNNFAFTTEYALASAILAVDLAKISALPTLTDQRGEHYKYNLPTLDDPSRNNIDGISDPKHPGYTGIDINDPFGGNDGINQAKIVPGGPVQIYASGFRNAYDLVLTQGGKMYSVDNGANAAWGGHPFGEGAYPGADAGKCTNAYVQGEPGSTGPGPNDPKVNNQNGLHYVRPLTAKDKNYPGNKERYYAGHPTPLRGNPAGAGIYKNGVFLPPGDPAMPVDWPPVPVSEAHPAECDFRNSGETDNTLANYGPSTNGIAEYAASNFGGAMKGHLLMAGFDGDIYEAVLNEAGDKVENCPAPPASCNASFASGFGSSPLDVIAQGDHEVFPGTVWVAVHGSNKITVFEPADYDKSMEPGGCNTQVASDDSDKDGFSNADEAANGTNPCSGAGKPRDNDGDRVSDLWDMDDDNDGLDDAVDPFALDVNNGSKANFPIHYEFFNASPGFGFFGLGFTGLMADGITDYAQRFHANDVVAGGTAGLLTVPVSAGDASTPDSAQQNAFQFGVASRSNSGVFSVITQINAPFFNAQTPVGTPSQGFFLGTGDQDNYVKLVLSAARGLEVAVENQGVVTSAIYPEAGANLLGGTQITFYLTVDPEAGTVQPAYKLAGANVAPLGGPVALTGATLAAVRGSHSVNNVPTALAVGLISTSAETERSFSATWDYLRILPGSPAADGSFPQGPAAPTGPLSRGSWETSQTTGQPIARHEAGLVAASGKIYLLGGRGIKPTSVFDPGTSTWSTASAPPLELHHVQPVALNERIYVVGAMTGPYPNETPVPHVYVFDPASNTWSQGLEIPLARRRGAAGVAVHNGKIYVVGGLTNGHNGGFVNWLDEFDPVAGNWATLPNAPRARDHFQAAAVGGKLYAAGGRTTSGSTGQTFELTVAEVDVFDLTEGNWSTLPASGNIPTPRAGSSSIAIGNSLVVLGGESGTQATAHAEVEALHLPSMTWAPLSPLQEGRHGTGVALFNGGLFTASGSGNRGGAPELTSSESWTP